MILKRNDKILIGIGVIIVIIAIIGILLYQSPKETDTGQQSNTDMITYNVKWDVKSEKLSPISGFVDRKTGYENKITLAKGNLCTITFNLTWVDNRAFLKRFGLDTLTLEITTPDGKVEVQGARSAKKTLEGRVEIKFSGITSMPPTTPITAEDEFTAESQLLKSPYYNDKWANKNINIKISDTVGEILKFRDRGNDFTLEVIYEYYSAQLTEQEPPKGTNYNPLGDFQDEGYDAPYLSMILSTGCGRYV